MNCHHQQAPEGFPSRLDTIAALFSWRPLCLGGLLLVGTAILFAQSQPKTADLKAEYAKTLIELSKTIVAQQVREPADPNFGAIRCIHCNVYHTRAAESVFPLYVSYTITHDKKYLKAAIDVADWLIRQQFPDGSWQETPEDWTGTTTDQLLMMAETYSGIRQHLTAAQQTSWLTTMRKAADYLVKVMTPQWASINYVATTTATLASVNRVVPDPDYLVRAKELAHRTISKIDDDGFLAGEGGRERENKYGVDLGYNMEMSLWGLGYYARITKDTVVENAVRTALRTHAYFIYPDGSLDASWGIRSNKWTTFGSATSDGCQVVFTLFADDQPYYATAAFKNLQYLRTNITNGFIGYGPQYADLFTKPPCVYPTFTKAKNLALSYMLEPGGVRTLAPLPTDRTGWLKYFPTIQVAEVRTKNFMVTIPAYRYKDIEKKDKSKYMFRPTGGSISNLWVEGYGALQSSSQTFYARWEPMSFPEVDTVITLTPRIEFRAQGRYYTNLFEFDGVMTTSSGTDGSYSVKTSGELRDRVWYAGGIGYQITHTIGDSEIVKTVELTYHDAWERVQIVEPLIQWAGMTAVKTDEKTVLITTPARQFELKLIEGNARLVLGRDAAHYWSPYPALKAYPIELEIEKPVTGFKQRVTYRISIVEKP
jgi:hypothetical protein